MSGFERIEDRENGRIELTDQEHLNKMLPDRFKKVLDIPDKMETLPYENKILIDERKKDAKSKSKSPKKKSKKVHRKSH